MWLCDLEIAVKDIKDFCNECCIESVKGCWNGGIAFHLSDHTTLLWFTDHSVKVVKEGD